MFRSHGGQGSRAIRSITLFIERKLLMKYLITGCSGFVGRYLIDNILGHEANAEIVGVDMTPSSILSPQRFAFRKLNLLDARAVGELLGEARPDFAVHLASYSSVSYSWQHPIDSFTNNTNIFLNLLDAIRNWAPACRLLSVGSSEEYGLVTQEEIPLQEKQPCVRQALTRWRGWLREPLYGLCESVCDEYRMHAIVQPYRGGTI